MTKTMNAKVNECKRLWGQRTMTPKYILWVPTTMSAKGHLVYAKTMNVKIYDWKRLWVQKAVYAKTMNVKNYDYDCKSWWLKKDFDDYKILVHERLWVPMGKECQRPWLQRIWLQKTMIEKDNVCKRLLLQKTTAAKDCDCKKNWKCKRPC